MQLIGKTPGRGSIKRISNKEQEMLNGEEASHGLMIIDDWMIDHWLGKYDGCISELLYLFEIM